MKLPTKKITKFNFYKDFKLKKIKIKFIKKNQKQKQKNIKDKK